MARPATGSPRWNKTARTWEVRVTLASGERSRPIAMTGLPACTVRPDDPERRCACSSCALARDGARQTSRRLRNGAAVDVATAETANEWFGRYNAYQSELGQTDADKKRTRWEKWIAPIIGHKPMASVTRDDIEDVRDALDAAIEAWKREGKSAGTKGRAISGKTAMNVWSCLTSSFKAAKNSKRRDLRALDGQPNPCADVEPPGDRDSRAVRRKTFVYPKEAIALLACEVIELEWREVYAVALFTYVRPGELRVLTWGDVDLQLGHVSITKAWDYRDEKIKPPKTRNGVRKVPIEATLAPLLRRMREGKDGGELVVPCLSVFGEDHLAEQWRKHLLVAGVERVELHASTRTHVQSNFRSCRDSGLTWLALAGVDVTKMMRRAGHDRVQTTMGYVKLAEDLTGDLGVPFPPLPAELVAGPESFGRVSEFRSPETPKTPLNQCRRRELKPGESSPESTAATTPQPEKTARSDDPKSDDSPPVSQRPDPDEALRAAIRAALDAGDLARVKALVSILEAAPPASAPVAPVVDLMTRRRG